MTLSLSLRPCSSSGSRELCSYRARSLDYSLARYGDGGGGGGDDVGALRGARLLLGARTASAVLAGPSLTSTSTTTKHQRVKIRLDAVGCDIRMLPVF
jgi:hypothetical protein